MQLAKMRPVWAEINLNHLENNLREIRKIIKADTRILAVVKADGYGHGAVNIVEVLNANGIERFAVSTLSEALEIRRHFPSIQIHILGYTPDMNADDVIKNDITQTIYSLDQAKAYSEKAVELDRRVKIHIKIDTGMNRLGFFDCEEDIGKIKEVVHLPNLDIEGVFTHFAAADMENREYTQLQYGKFNDLLGKLEREGIEIPVRHCSNSAGIIEFPEMNMNMVRPGIILYGLYPSDCVDHSKIRLKPVLSLKTKISHLKEISAGECVSYGLTYKSTKKTKVATLPIGYADGYFRSLSNKAYVLCHGRKVPVIGTICMDQCMIDVTEIEHIAVEDEVTLIGEELGQTVGADDLANWIGTIPYEVVCVLGRRVPRMYIKNNEITKIRDYILE